MTLTDESGRGRMIAGRYELHDPIGRGGMGTVWQASDVVLCRDVAIKEVTFPLYTTPDERAQLRERTLREARAVARFEHPQATAVHDVVEEDGRPWIVMELVPSQTLADHIRQDGPLSPLASARMGVDVLGVLQAAHRAGIVHRDVKPGNVLLDRHGRAWLTDFGIATSVGDPSLTQEGILLGSPAYMAPERASGAEPEPASDLWSLGATLYSAVEGRPPFERGEAIATLLSVASDEPAPYRAAGPLEPVIRALLNKDPAARPSDDQALAWLQGVVREAERDDNGGSSRPGAAAAPDAAKSARGEVVERLDRTMLLSLATTTGAATRAVARAAVHKAAGKLEGAQAHAARSLTDRERPRRGRGHRQAEARPQPVAPAMAPQPVAPPVAERPVATPPPAAPPAGRSPAGPGRKQHGRAAAKEAHQAERPRWRFKRRWIGIPLAALLLVFLLFIAAVGGLLWFVIQSASTPTGAVLTHLTWSHLGPW